MAAPAPEEMAIKDMAEAHACVSALLAAHGQEVSSAEAQKLACILSDLRLYGMLEPLRAPGLMAAAFATARRVPANWQAWDCACYMTATLVAEDPQSAPQRVAEALAAGAPAFALDCARRFIDRPEAVTTALVALRVLEPVAHAREWPEMPEVVLAALAQHAQNAALVTQATQLLQFAAAHDPDLAALVLKRADVVAAALAAQGDHHGAGLACVVLLDFVAWRGVGEEGGSAAAAARNAMMTPAVVRDTLRVLNVDLGQASRVDPCARLLHRAPAASLEAVPGVATALVGALKARPDEALFVVSAVFRNITCHTWDVSKMIGTEVRAAGGLLPLTRALRTCVAARGESDKHEAEKAGGIISAAYLAAICTPPGHDDADVDEALRAGAAVSALALASRHSLRADLVIQCFGFLERIAINPARRAAVAAAGVYKVAAAMLRAHPAHAPLNTRVLAAVATVDFNFDAGRAAAFADAGLVEAAARVLAAGGEAQNAAIIALLHSCHAPPANQARAVAAGVPAALLAALRAHLADVPAALAILQCFHVIVNGCTAASASAAAALPVLVDAMTAHPGNAELQAYAGRALDAVLRLMPPETSKAVLPGKAPALLAALDEGLRRHGAVPGTVSGLGRASLCLCAWGFRAPQHLMTALAQAAHPDAPEDILLDMYQVVTPAATRYLNAGAQFTAQQLAGVLATAQRHGATNIELAAMPLTVIAAHMRRDASLVALLLEGALTAAVALGTTSSRAGNCDRMRIAAATLVGVAVESANGDFVAAGAAATRAGVLPLIEQGGSLADVKPWEMDMEPVRGVLIMRLQAAIEVHDAAVCSAPGACARCAQLRASCKRCGLPGCGASRRADDAGRTMAKCGDCCRLAYCCSAHQKEDWARHKAECRAAAAAQADDEQDEEP